MASPQELPPDSLAAKRQRYIERQRLLHPERTNASSRSGEARGSGPPNRHGAPKVPVAQRVVPNWPVLDLGDIPRVERASYLLEITGLVENPTTLDFAGLMALPQVEEASDFHCVTGWSRLDMVFRGVRFRDLCEFVVPTERATHVVATGYDIAPGTDIPYTTNLELGRALDPDVLIAHSVDGAPLAPEHGGPVRMVTPRLYAWKGAKWIRRIEFTAGDRPGFWEVRGYSNSADPWTDDRYSNGPPPGAFSDVAIYD